MRRNSLIVLLFLLALLVATGFPGAEAAEPTKASVTLDWTPNPDHVGLYYARDAGFFSAAGLDVTIRPPSDPTAPLKLVAAGATDLAVSYEQEVFLAVEKHLPVVAVAAVVPRPLNSVISIDKSIRRVSDLEGRKIGITGVPSDISILDTVLASAHLTRDDVTVVNVGYSLLPALLAHRVDAVIGVYANVEGVELRLRGLHPTVIPVDRGGVPTYAELVLVASSDRLAHDASYRSLVRRFVSAFTAGTQAAQHHPKAALASLTRATASDPEYLANATAATLPLLDGTRGVGCLLPAEWRRFGNWMRARKLLARVVPTSSVVDTRFTPARCSGGG